MNLSPEDFGVPAGGYMILSIDSDGFPPSYGSRWENTQFASDADGQLHFTDIPMVRVGSHVTVTLLCYTADGTLVSSGYSSGTATENGVPLEIGILGSAQIVLGSNSAPNGSTSEHDGVVYDIIEYTGAGLEMAAVNTTAGSTMEVVLNGTVISTTTDQSFTANLSDGYNAIEVTVTKGSNEPVVVRRNIYVVRQFCRPVIALGSNGTANGRTATGTDGRTYDVIEYTGTGLGVTVTNGFEGNATFDVQINGSSVSGTPVTGGATSVNQTLADGFNAITATLTESVNGSVQAEKYIYVVKKLVKPVITMSGATANGKTASSGGKSYTVIEYEGTSPTVTVTNSYDGDGAGTTPSVFTVTHNGSTASASMTLSDGFNAIVATLEKEHCVTQKDEKYYYVVKKLVVPVITMSGATPNGKTATSGGKTYTVIEYESTLPTVTITNSYNGSSASYEAKLGTTVLSTACPSTITNHTLSDGFNAVTATLSEPYCDTVKEEKYYYVVKVLTKPTVTYSDGMLTDEAADAGGYHMLRYSYLADPIVMPKFSATNPYSDGSVTMTVKLDGTTLTGEATTGDISNRALTDGTHTIIITLSNDYCTEVSVTKKINVKMKAVKVQISGTIHGWYENGKPGDAPLLTQDFYIQAVNSSSAGEYADETGTRKTCASVQSQWATYNNTDANINTDSSNNYVYLTDPGSTFKFWTGQSNDDVQGSWWMGFVPENDSTTTKTLTQLKASSANRSFDSGDRNNAGNPASGGVRSRYWVTVTIEDAAYTDGTDDEPPSSP